MAPWKVENSTVITTRKRLCSSVVQGMPTFFLPAGLLAAAAAGAAAHAVPPKSPAIVCGWPPFAFLLSCIVQSDWLALESERTIIAWSSASTIVAEASEGSSASSGGLSSDPMSDETMVCL